MIPYRARHVALIKPDVSDEWQELALRAQDEGRGYTACLEGDPIGCAGVRVINPGVGEAWALFSPLIRTMPKTLFKAVRTGLDEIIAEEKLKKLVSIVDMEDKAALRFMAHLGFSPKRLIVERTLEAADEP